MDQILAEDTDSCVLKLRHRPSRQGGRPWVTPTITPPQLAVVRRTRAAAPVRSTALAASTTLTVGGSLGYDPSGVIRGLMAVIRERTGVAVQEQGAVDATTGDTSNTWCRLADQDPAAHPGRVRLNLTSLDDARKIMEDVHGKAVQLGVDLLTVTVANDEIERQQGNGRRGRGGQGPAPDALPLAGPAAGRHRI